MTHRTPSNGIPVDIYTRAARVTGRARAASPRLGGNFAVVEQAGGAPAPAQMQQAIRPRLDAGCNDLPLMAKKAWAALQLHDLPKRMFTFGMEPVRLDPDPKGAPVPRSLTPDRLRGEVAEAAEWTLTRRVGDELKDVPWKPSKDVIATMLAMPKIPLPQLDRIVFAPVFGPNGELQTTPGYHEASRTYYYAPPGFDLPEVLPSPSQADVERAKQWILDEFLVDFPFVSDADMAHTVAELLLIPARALIDGPTPLHVHEAPAQGTGKDLLAEAMGLIVLGREPTTMSYGKEPEEFEKRLVASLRTMPEWIVLPNVRGEVKNDALADAISRGIFTGRILGSSEMARLIANNAWTLTANNAELSADFTRRSIRIRLDAQMERPQERTEFRNPQLKPWVKENRAALVWSVLTIIQSWIAAGCPKGTSTLGGFESWAETMGGILAHIEIPGFLENLHEFYESADSEAITKRAFVAAWWQQHGRASVGVASLFAIATSDEINLDLGDKSDRSQRTVLGKILGTMRDRHYRLDGEYSVRVEAAKVEHKTQQWRLKLLDRVDPPEKGDVDGQ